MSGVTFANPEYLFLLLLLPVLGYWYWRKERRLLVDLQISSIRPFQLTRRTWRQRLRHLLFVLRLTAVTLLVVALAA